MTISTTLLLGAALAAAAAVLLTLVLARRRGGAGVSATRPGPTRRPASTPDRTPDPVAPVAPAGPGRPGGAEEATLARHRRNTVEALERHAGGRSLCRVGPGAPGGVKESEGAVAALSQVARARRARPEEGLPAAVARVRREWTAELAHRAGLQWQAYREGGDRALRELAGALESQDSVDLPATGTTEPRRDPGERPGEPRYTLGGYLVGRVSPVLGRSKECM